MTTANAPAGEVIDAHLHLWDPRGGGYAWLGGAPEELRGPIGADRARAELDTVGVGSAILVQADDTLADTDFLLGQRAAQHWIVGVVGWLPIDDEARTAQHLETYASRLVGVRQLIHDDPRAGLLDAPEVRSALRRIAGAGLPLDVPDAFPRDLASAARLAADLPELTVVIDHLGKPPLAAGPGSDDFATWAREMRAVAAAPRAVAKLSGLRIPGARYDVATLRPAIEIALDAFGPDRLMYGGDWPMSLPAGGYLPTWQVLAELIGELSVTEQAAIWAGTARRTYRGIGDRDE